MTIDTIKKISSHGTFISYILLVASWFLITMIPEKRQLFTILIRIFFIIEFLFMLIYLYTFFKTNKTSIND